MHKVVGGTVDRLKVPCWEREKPAGIDLEFIVCLVV